MAFTAPMPTKQLAELLGRMALSLSAGEARNADD